MQLAVILQSVQTPFRCVRRESDPTQSRNLSAELRIVSYRLLRCAQGDAAYRDVLTRRDRPPRKEGKDLLSLLTRLDKVYDQCNCECMYVYFDVTTSKRFSRSLAQYYYALRCKTTIQNYTIIDSLKIFRSQTIRVSNKSNC